MYIYIYIYRKGALGQNAGGARLRPQECPPCQPRHDLPRAQPGEGAVNKNT